jgi:hypothetical protein
MFTVNVENQRVVGTAIWNATSECGEHSVKYVTASKPDTPGIRPTALLSLLAKSGPVTFVKSDSVMMH